MLQTHAAERNCENSSCTADICNHLQQQLWQNKCPIGVDELLKKNFLNKIFIETDSCMW